MQLLEDLDSAKAEYLVKSFNLKNSEEIVKGGGETFQASFAGGSFT